jgi:hypothetical protein
MGVLMPHSEQAKDSVYAEVDTSESALHMREDGGTDDGRLAAQVAAVLTVMKVFLTVVDWVDSKSISNLY